MKSEAGVGSTFAFNAWFGIGTPAERRKVVPEALNGARVLVVDDNPSAREVLADLLAELPFAVDQVGVGRGGGRRGAPGGRASAVPDRVHGLEDARHVGRRGGARHQVRRRRGAAPAVIMVTAFGREDVRQEAEEARLDGFLVKPVSASALVDAIIQVFAPETADVRAAAARRAAATASTA